MIRGTTRVAAVIGWPIEHSRSPQMFARAFAAAAIDAVMIPIGIPPEGLATIVGALRAMRALGASVTLPHKLAVTALCDELTAEARAIGAVNSLQFAGDRVVGHNTDGQGFRDALVAAGVAPAGRRCVILGAGGAARAVAYGLQLADVAAIDVIARRPEAVTWTAARAWNAAELQASFARADLVIDATSLDLPTADPGATAAKQAVLDALPLDALRRDAWVSTLTYHGAARLLQRAAERGHATLDGRGMLVHQGARSFLLWTGLAPPIPVMRQALDAALDGT
jgi:shikimate dehydrogenase